MYYSVVHSFDIRIRYCVYVKGQFLLHFAQAITDPSINADVPIVQSHTMYMGSNGVEYAFVVVSVPLTC